MDDSLAVIGISSFFSIIVAIITSLVSSVLYARQTKADLQKEYASRFNERKWETYMEFSSFVKDVFKSVKSGKKTNPDTYSMKLYDFAGSFWIVGSETVMRAYNDWRMYTQIVSQGEVTDEKFQSLVKLAQIVVEMRRDLGYTSDNTTAMDILRTFINDIDKYVI